jgi:dephospho-CoA kinase
VTDRESPPAESDPAAPAAGSAADGSPPGGSSPAGSSARHSPEGSQTVRSSRADSSPGGTVRIGITGPIGCGKSTVAAWLGELGAAVIDADLVARDVTAPGTPALAQVATVFGPHVVRDDGALDRAALGRIVFADPVALASLESIVHPAVRPVILRAMAAAERDGAPAVIVEAIKLVEGGLADLCDEVWLVTCSAEAQLARLHARLAARGADPADAQARIAGQPDLVARLTPFAARVLDLSGSRDEAHELVTAAYRDALASEDPA